MLTRDKITVPNQLLFEHVLGYLKQGKNVTIPVKGSSMKPFLREGDGVLLKPFEKKELRKGIIVLARVEDQMVLHRVVSYTEKDIWLAGDGNLVQKEQVDHTDVLATAVRISRGDAEMDVTQRWRCVLGQLWYWVRPIRRVAMKLINL